MITPSANYTTENAKLFRKPVYTLTFDGITQVYSTHKLPGTTWKPYLKIDSIRGLSSEVEPERGRSTTGVFSIVAEDVDENITALVAQGIGGRQATLGAGFVGLATTDFEDIATLIVESYPLTDDLNGYEIGGADLSILANKQVHEVAATTLGAVLAQATTDSYYHTVLVASNLGGLWTTSNALASVAMSAALASEWGAGNYTLVSSVASVGTTITVDDTTFFLSAGYLIIDAEIIQYTGKTATTFTGLTRGSLGTTAALHLEGANVRELLRVTGHPMDIAVSTMTATDKTGVSIGSSLVNTTAFGSVESALGTTYSMEFRITSRSNAQDWLSDEIYAITGTVPVTEGSLLSVYEIEEPASGDEVATFTEDSIIEGSLRWDPNNESIINVVGTYYDWNPITEQYENYYETEDALSIATYGRKPMSFYSGGLRSSLSGTSTFIAARHSALLTRYRNGAPIIRCRTHLQKNLVELGDIVAVTHSKIPNRSTGARGVTSGLFEVIRRDILPDSVEWTLLWSSFSTLYADSFTQADSVAPDYTISGWDTNSQSDLGSLRVISNQLYAGRGITPGTGGHGVMWRTGSESFAITNQISELEFVSNSGSTRSGPIVRYDSTGGYLNCTCYVAMYQPGSGQIFLRKFVGEDLTSSDGTSLGSYVVTLVAGDRVRIHANGTSVIVYVNDVSVITATDTAIASGVPGVMVDTAANVSTRWDNWRGGGDGWA